MTTPITRPTASRNLVCIALIVLAATAACTRPANDEAVLDPIAERYVRLALALRAYDADYVDAYSGPPEWAREAEESSMSLADLRTGTEEQLAAVLEVDPSGWPDIVAARAAGLEKRLRSMLLRIEMANGERLPFDDESALLFDATAPVFDDDYFRDQIAEIDALVPGEGPLSDRVDAFRRRFEIPADRLEAVFDAAIAECRRRTLEHVALPADERFVVEFVTDQPWSGYNWYQGDHYSVIQVNTDLPVRIGGALNLGCHEGYPGHHTYNVLIEQQLVEARGWIEFTLVPLYGPRSLISEGSADFGVELAFPDDERRRFEQDVLFPLAGLDPATAGRYRAFSDAMEALSYTGVAAARAYLDGERDAGQTIDWLREFALSDAERAAQSIEFYDRYRSYVINYALGSDLVAGYIEAVAGDDPERQWAAFESLLSRPASPGDLN